MNLFKRRTVLGGLAVGSAVLTGVFFLNSARKTQASSNKAENEYAEISDAEWKTRLTAMQYYVLREEGTEQAHSSPLNDEKRTGTFHCVACDNKLFASETKYDSGTGWPSFYDHLPGSLGTKKDYKLILPRTEYHCARCGGHHGHVFDDGPQPTGLRYCNNGIALKFVPA